MQLNMSKRKGKHGRVKFEREEHRFGYHGFYLSLKKITEIKVLLLSEMLE